MQLPDTKHELLNLMKASRELNVFDNTKQWRKAFELYNAATGNHLKTSDSCSRCFISVKEWLTS